MEECELSAEVRVRNFIFYTQRVSSNPGMGRKNKLHNDSKYVRTMVLLADITSKRERDIMGKFPFL